jgi:uncharacterized protein (DUF2141 family)
MRKEFKILMRILPIFLVNIGNLSFSTNARADLNGNLTVEVDGLKKQKGQICFSLFGSSEGFPGQGKRALQAKCVKILSGSPKLTFSNLKAGSYAVAVFHDIKGDGTLKRNALGIPTEGFGFSNNPPILTGPPKFNDSAVFVAGPNTNIQINLLYLFGN